MASRQPKPLPSNERLNQLFEYNPVTGVFVWRPRFILGKGNRPSKRGGKIAGNLNQRLSRWMLSVDGKQYYAHRVAWKTMTGDDPGDRQIDHKNLDKLDNRWVNLRLADHSQNKTNTGPYKNKGVPWKGVSRDKERGGWYAQIAKDRKHYHLGRFDCPAAAHFAYCIAADKLHGEFARIH